MELGSYSIRKYPFPNRKIVNSKEWNYLCEKARVSSLYGFPDPEIDREFFGFDNNVFTIRPYYWGDDEEEMNLPNFLYKPTGFEIEWYKYAFRDAYMNQDLSEKDILEIFKKCAESIK